jgi:shikimate kinase
MARPCRLILVGMMGTGKTSVGRLLAKRTGWQYADNDELLLQLVGKTPRDLLSEDGEAALRDAESAALRTGLLTPEPAIVSVAGGTILDPENRRDLQAAGLVVWLKAGPTAIQQRATGAPHRAWLDTGGLDWIREAVVVRDPLYASVADLTIEVDRRSSRQVARDVLTWMGQVDACRAFLPPGDRPHS